ncbi:hypothetical protein [Candidatus Chlorohelix sp.]|uniref:hypothetical protein n=1 Tax=Candidatus Chlorohelix sp. TaxID=3139201 RepID=UPI00302E12EE
MEIHEQQQFDFLLVTAVARYTERLAHRNAGAENALQKLRENQQGDGIWLNQYVDAIFQDFLLDNVAGACFILKALSKRNLTNDITLQGSVEQVLISMAKQVFTELFRQKVEESLEQATIF